MLHTSGFCTALLRLLLSSLLPGLLLFSACSYAAERPVRTIPRNSVIEFELSCDKPFENPFLEVQAAAVFTGPEGSPVVRVDGFYDGGALWKFRFVPRVEGTWQVSLSLMNQGRTVAESREWFRCQGQAGKGFLERSPANPYRLQYGDGTPFYAVGIQPCGAAEEGLDGPPAGHGQWRSVPMDTFLQAFQGAANLFRIQLGQGTRAGCAREVMTRELGPYRYNLEACQLLDRTYSLLGQYGFSTILILFQDMSLWQTDNTLFGTNKDLEGWKNIHNEQAVAPVKHYLRYAIARWAAYTDIWELFNEDSYTPDDWREPIAAYVRGLDPYGHLLTTNYERPRAAWADVVTAHMYMAIPAWETEGQLTREFARLKSFGKPVMFTEFGNKGWLSNRDPDKWRIAVWTAFMNESSMLFWSMSGIQTVPDTLRRGGNANAYLGPEDRRYFRNFAAFAQDLTTDLRPAMVGYGGGIDPLNRYALSNGRLSVLYLQHRTGHDSAVAVDIFLWSGPGEFEVRWFDPRSGEWSGPERRATEGEVLRLRSPEVSQDMAAKIVKVD